MEQRAENIVHFENRHAADKDRRFWSRRNASGAHLGAGFIR
jgi:hypothetical protein